MEFVSVVSAMVMVLSFAASTAPASENGTTAKPHRLLLSLGQEDERKRLFHPDRLVLVAGKRYTLVIQNPSLEVHEFDAPGLVAAAWSSHVKVLDDIGATARPIAKIVGTPAEMEILPGGSVEWTFVPVVAGSYDILCDIKDQSGKTHTAMGMQGTIVEK
jgi:uncharacterized cupredoxin-like copper-binding protein